MQHDSLSQPTQNTDSHCDLEAEIISLRYCGASAEAGSDRSHHSVPNCALELRPSKRLKASVQLPELQPLKKRRGRPPRSGQDTASLYLSPAAVVRGLDSSFQVPAHEGPPVALAERSISLALGPTVVALGTVEPQPPKRGRGRPPKSGQAKASSELSLDVESRSLASPLHVSTHEGPPVAPWEGSSSLGHEPAVVAPATMEAQSPKRGTGRPPKSAQDKASSDLPLDMDARSVASPIHVPTHARPPVAPWEGSSSHAPEPDFVAPDTVEVEAQPPNRVKERPPKSGRDNESLDLPPVMEARMFAASSQVPAHEGPTVALMQRSILPFPEPTVFAPATVELDPDGKCHKFREMLFAMMNDRETIAHNRVRGLSGLQAYDGVSNTFQAFFKRRVCPNVQRRKDRTTLNLHRFAAAHQRFQQCKTPHEKEHLKKLFVLNFALWRFVGGTLAFAREVGFLTDWTESEKERVRYVVRAAFIGDRIEDIFSAAYQSPCKLRRQLGRNCDVDRFEAALYNTGPKAFRQEPGLTQFSLVGKLRVIDHVWELAPAVVKAAAADSATGVVRWEPVVNELGRVPYFGSDEDFMRVPTFFAKEVGQDLLDTPVFENGRASVADLRSFCPAGPGASLGLTLCFDLKEKLALPKLAQRDSIALMQALLHELSEPGRWAHGDPAELELHDVQFMLCELQKAAREGNSHAKLRDYLGPQAPEEALTSVTPQALFEALALFGYNSKVGADDSAFTYQLSSDELFDAFAKWQGLNLLPAAQTGPIHHGDRVQLKLASDVDVPLYIDAKSNDKMLRLAACSSGSSVFEKHTTTEAGHTFLIERRDGTGMLCFGNDFFLRASGGAHVGPGGALQKRLDAKQTSERYGSTRQFQLRRLCGDSNNDHTTVESGEAVEIHCHSRPGEVYVLEACPERGCRIVNRTQSTPEYRKFKLERSTAVADAERRLRDAFEQVLKECVCNRGLTVCAGGDLRVEEFEPIRRAVVGMPPSH